jgi:hypothetical protein
MLVSGPSIDRLFFVIVPGCLGNEENREAGENPARSRHCDENFLRVRRPAHALQPLNTRAKVFQAAPGSNLFPLTPFTLRTGGQWVSCF